jgi:hypothetical protein
LFLVLQASLQAVDALEKGFEDVGLWAAFFRDGICSDLISSVPQPRSTQTPRNRKRKKGEKYYCLRK